MSRGQTPQENPELIMSQCQSQGPHCIIISLSLPPSCIRGHRGVFPQVVCGCVYTPAEREETGQRLSKETERRIFFLRWLLLPQAATESKIPTPTPALDAVTRASEGKNAFQHASFLSQVKIRSRVIENKNALPSFIDGPSVKTLWQAGVGRVSS